MNKWIPIVEKLPDFNKTVIVELWNEYLGEDQQVIAAQIYRNPYTGNMYWLTLGKFPDIRGIEKIPVSSTHIWTEMPISSCQYLNWYVCQENNNG